MFTVYHINAHHVYNKLLSSLLKTVFEFIKNDKIVNSSFSIHFSQSSRRKIKVVFFLLSFSDLSHHRTCRSAYGGSYFGCHSR